MKQMIIMIPETDQERATHNTFHGLVTMDGKLTQQGEALVEVVIGLLNKACFKNSFAHGWYEQYMQGGAQIGDPMELGQRNFGEVMALITSEVSEAFEAYRDGDDQTKIKYGYKFDGESNFRAEPVVSHVIDGDVLGKPEGITAELADVLIRVFDYAGAYQLPLGEAVIRKHLYNHSRPYRHGGKKA